MAIINQLQLNGQIVNTPFIRHSPSGIGHAEFLFEHRSVQFESSVSRQVYCKIPAVVSGDLYTQHVIQLEKDKCLQLTGFLSTRQLRSGASDLIFYVQFIELTKESEK